MTLHQISHEILGIGSPCVDLIIEVNEQDLAKIPGGKGGMIPVSYQTLVELIEHAGKEPVLAMGGSAANTVRGLAHLGRRCALLGKIGKDQLGKWFINRLKASKIRSYLAFSDTQTAQIVCLITPDKERTMRSYLGAGGELQIVDVVPKAFQGVNLVHVEGYCLLNDQVIDHVMKSAKKAGALISFDLGSYELVNMYRERMINLLSNYVDIVFANREELFALTQVSMDKGCEFLSSICQVAVILMGKEGCMVVNQKEAVRCPAVQTSVVDTTGAGDLFASGFLHGFLQGYSLEDCGRSGALLGAAVVEVQGVNIPPDRWEFLKEEIGGMRR